MMLTKENTDLKRKRLVQEHIDLILAEMKSRKGYSEVLNDNNLEQ